LVTQVGYFQRVKLESMSHSDMERKKMAVPSSSLQTQHLNYYIIAREE
jgi:hypothetical protein